LLLPLILFAGCAPEELPEINYLKEKNFLFIKEYYWIRESLW
jgi:hypothetical protein